MKDDYPLCCLNFMDWNRILLAVETVLLKKNSKELKELGVIVKK